MSPDILDTIRDCLQEEIDRELDSRETFSEEMVEHIRNVYADLRRQKEEWLENHTQTQ